MKGPIVGAWLIFVICIPTYLIVKQPLIAAVILVAVIVAAAVAIVSRAQSDARVDMSEVDLMRGDEFERYVAGLLRKNGFSNVQLTKASGDYGVDILANKNGERFAIQCKRYARNVGVKPVQEVYSGAAMYGATSYAVITNMYFSDNGRALASRLGVQLWDRDRLGAMMKNTGR